MKLSRQEYWSGLPFPTPGESSRPRDCLLHWQADSLPPEPPGNPIHQHKLLSCISSFPLVMCQCLISLPPWIQHIQSGPYVMDCYLGLTQIHFTSWSTHPQEPGLLSDNPTQLSPFLESLLGPNGRQASAPTAHFGPTSTTDYLMRGCRKPALSSQDGVGSDLICARESPCRLGLWLNPHPCLDSSLCHFIPLTLLLLPSVLWRKFPCQALPLGDPA